ncbi:MAG: hypothetical protein ACRDJN_08010, partial [Chloroflexota bacterium]
DELLGLHFVDGTGAPWTVRTFPRRNATDMSAWYAVLCRPFHSGPRAVRAGEIIQRTCVRLVANPTGGPWATGTSGVSCTWGVTSDGAAPSLAIDVPGLDNRRYRIRADWAERTASVQARPAHAGMEQDASSRHPGHTGSTGGRA